MTMLMKLGRTAGHRNISSRTSSLKPLSTSSSSSVAASRWAPSSSSASASSSSASTSTLTLTGQSTRNFSQSFPNKYRTLPSYGMNKDKSWSSSSLAHALFKPQKKNLSAAVSSSDAPGIKTALYDEHVKRGGKMVEFAGYALPVQYEKLGLVEEHNKTRESAGLFDVSHMGQIKIKGPDRVAFMEKLTVGDLASLKQGESKLSMLTNEKGGIKDDTVVTNAGDYLYVVVNGACKHKDLEHMRSYANEFNVEIEYMENASLLALQGPKAEEVLKQHVSDPAQLESMGFMTSILTQIAGTECRVTRCGYTGEDGFELSIEDEKVAPTYMQLLLDDGRVTPAGLGARDTLRLEAGLCLYGTDLDEDTTPVEGTLLFTVSKNRRAKADFLGAETILKQIAEKPKRKRVGILVEGAPVRGHSKIFDESGNEEIGEVSSGTFSPTLKRPIAMGFVKTPYSKVGTSLKLEYRGKKKVAGTVAKMPFVQTNYKKS